jgi:hypothetical protein
MNSEKTRQAREIVLNLDLRGYLTAYLASVQAKDAEWKKAWKVEMPLQMQTQARRDTVEKLATVFPKIEYYYAIYRKEFGASRKGKKGHPIDHEGKSLDYYVGFNIQNAIARMLKDGKVEDGLVKEVRPTSPRAKSGQEFPPEGQETGNWLRPITKYKRMIERHDMAPSDALAASLLSIPMAEVERIRQVLTKDYVFERIQLYGPSTTTTSGQFGSYMFRVKRKPKPKEETPAAAPAPAVPRQVTQEVKPVLPIEIPKGKTLMGSSVPAPKPLPTPTVPEAVPLVDRLKHRMSSMSKEELADLKAFIDSKA